MGFSLWCSTGSETIKYKVFRVNTCIWKLIRLQIENNLWPKIKSLQCTVQLLIENDQWWVTARVFTYRRFGCLLLILHLINNTHCVLCLSLIKIFFMVVYDNSLMQHRKWKSEPQISKAFSRQNHLHLITKLSCWQTKIIHLSLHLEKERCLRRFGDLDLLRLRSTNEMAICKQGEFK